MYTASIFMSLHSLLSDSYDNGIELAEHKVGFFSYGSGSKSKVFEGIFQPGWKNKIISSPLFTTLNSRTKISVDTYEQLHNGALKSDYSKGNHVHLDRIEETDNKQGLRVYSTLVEQE